MSDEPKPAAETGQTSATLPLAILQALRSVSAMTGVSQSQLIAEALLADARIALEMDLRARATEAGRG
jgi:hypothetical protein